MTVCIAAACRDRDRNAIILCSDQRFENSFVGGETGKKLFVVAPGWAAMLAGDVSRARELLSMYGDHLASKVPDLTPFNISHELRKPAEKFKATLIEGFVRSQLGMSYAEFLSNGALLGNVYVEMLYQIRTLTLGCSLIITGFIGLEGFIFSVSDSGGVDRHMPFAAIGSGEIMAASMLYRRDYTEWFDLQHALYCVYEAKKTSESAPGVGKTTNICVICAIRPNVSAMRFVMRPGLDWLEANYASLSPRSLAEVTAEPENSLSSYENPLERPPELPEPSPDEASA